jgi:hypothetical protein
LLRDIELKSQDINQGVEIIQGDTKMMGQSGKLNPKKTLKSKNKSKTLKKQATAMTNDEMQPSDEETIDIEDLNRLRSKMEDINSKINC